MAGNNIPFEPGDSSAYKKGNAPTQSFSKKHRGAPGNPNSPKNAPRDTSGNASGGGQGAGNAVLQRAAGKKLFGGKGGSFAANYSRNT